MYHMEGTKIGAKHAVLVVWGKYILTPTFG